MITVEYPHLKEESLIALLKRIGVMSIMGAAVIEAGSRHGVTIAGKMFQSPYVDLGLSLRIKKIWQELQEDPAYTSSLLYDRYSGINKFIRVKAATSHALEMHYTYDEHVDRYGIGDPVARVLSDLWMRHSASSRAIRNRYAIVVQLLTYACTEILVHHEELRICSLASGSAQAVVEVLAKVHAHFPHKHIHMLLIDFDPSALKKARADIEKHAPFVEFTTKVGNVYRLDKVAARIDDFSPHLIEMIGFLDYIDNQEAPKILRQLRAFDPEHFLTCNVLPAYEKIVLHTVVMWPRMIYRTSQKLYDVLAQGDFVDAEIYVEPYAIHAVAHWQKNT